MNQQTTVNPIDETLRRRFEQARRADRGARIEDHLPAANSPEYPGTLEELVCIDLELAWAASGRETAVRPTTIEAYLARFPCLAEEPVLRRLVLHEYQLRWRAGDSPDRADYASRFPHVIIEGAMTLAQAPATAIVTAAGNGEDDDAPAYDSVLANLDGYQVEGVAGRGGMGLVLKARDLALGRAVAIKIPLRGSLSKSEADRFLREARAAASLRHANICPIHEVGEHRGRPYIAMGYVDGLTLGQWAKEQKPTAHAAAKMIAAIARAVAYAHEHDVVHRDIKPANVLVDAESGQPILTDFGLAKEASSSAASLLTQDGTVLGTPAYMSPEQAAGRSDAIGPATDIYSLGAMLYELLSGEPPFNGSVGEILKKVQVDSIEPLRRRAPRVHRDLETICMKATARSPRDRYPSAGALADDLDRFAAGEAIHARRESMPRKLVRKVKRHPALAASVVAVVVLVAVLLRSTSRGRETANLNRAIDTAIAADLWTPDSISAIDGHLARLGQLDVAQGNARRQQVNQALSGSIQRLLREAAFGSDVEALADEQIAMLSARAPELGASLRDALIQRRRAWEPLIVQEAPFPNRNWRGAGAAKPDGAELLFQPHPASVVTGYAPLTFGVPATGNVQAEIVVAGNWASAPLPMLVLGGTPDPMSSKRPIWGYSFWLEDPAATRRVGDLRMSRGELTAGCARDGLTLRTWTIPVSAIATGPLRVLARREGQRLLLQVNDLPPMEVQDIFVPTPRVGATVVAYLPPGARLARLRADRQSQPVAPSPLERGDLLYQANQFADALAYYQAQTIGSGNTPAGQEARYKQGLCLLALTRAAEAERLFEPLFVEPGDPWPALAGSQLLAIRARQGRFSDADAILRTLRSRFPPERMRLYLPQDVTTAMVRVAAARIAGLNSFMKVAPDAAENLKLVHELRLILDPNEATQHRLYDLMRTYELAGDDEQALRYASQLMEHKAVYSEFAVYEHFGSMMRTRGQASAAIAEVDARLVDASGGYFADRLPLLVERARLHYALGDTAAAERDLDDYIRLSEDARERYYIYDGAAALMRGLLRQDRGDAAGAVADFKWGTHDRFKQRPGAAPSQYGGFHNSTLSLITGAFAGELTDRQVQQIIQFTLTQHSVRPDQSEASSPLNAYLVLYQTGVIDMPPSTFRQMWLTPRGRAMAREVAFRSTPLPEMSRRLLSLGIYQWFRQGCFANEPDAAQDEAIWNIALMGCDAARDRKVGKDQLLQLFLTWKGTTGIFGWGAVQKTLEPRFRGSMAYVFGKRCLILKQPKDAAAMFRQAIDTPEVDDAVRRLAEGELKGLSN